MLACRDRCNIWDLWLPHRVQGIRKTTGRLKDLGMDSEEKSRGDLFMWKSTVGFFEENSDVILRVH